MATRSSTHKDRHQTPRQPYILSTVSANAPKSYLPNTHFYSNNWIAGKSMPILGYSRCCKCAVIKCTRGKASRTLQVTQPVEHASRVPLVTATELFHLVQYTPYIECSFQKDTSDPSCRRPSGNCSVTHIGACRRPSAGALW